MTVYNPLYDPLVDSHPGQGSEYAPTYWVATAGEPPQLDSPVGSDMDVDVAIIGAGFTGLATALFLVEEYGIKAVVLEANKLAWGCTSRNGGQGQFNCGRLSRGQWVKRWGEAISLRLHQDVKEGYELFKNLVSRIGDYCQPQGDGHLLVAHRAAQMTKLEQESELCNKLFGYGTRILHKNDLQQHYLNDAEAHGALLEPEGIGVHPLRLAYAYTRMVREQGVTIHPSSPVISWSNAGGKHKLITPGGVVTADRVAVATGGYTSAGLHEDIAYRYMPILSNSVVTRVLTADEIAAAGLKTKLVITDTRNLRFYYRLLPDNRLQMGTRSAITGKDAANNKHYNLLVQGLYRKFPVLAGVEIAYSWWGWVDVSHDMMPRIVESHKGSGLFYSCGYGGNGVAFSIHGGKRMADQIAGKTTNYENLPIYNSALPRHPLTPFRRLGQRLFYRYYALKDMLP